MLFSKKKLGLLFLFSGCLSVAFADVKITSPNGQLEVNVSINNKSNQEYGIPVFTLSKQVGKSFQNVLVNAQMGLTTSLQNFNAVKWGQNGKTKKNIIDYTLIEGKQTHIKKTETEQTLNFINAKQQVLSVVFKLANDGLAFRYQVKTSPDEKIQKDLTVYPIAEGTKRWMQKYIPDSYEAFYPLSTSGYDANRSGNRIWAYPALMEISKGQFLFLTESNITYNHCASRLNNQAKPDAYQVEFADPSQSTEGAEWKSSWRVILAGNLATLVQSTRVTDVAAPNALKNTDWIHPGSVSWIYWAYNHGSRDFKRVKEYIDLAVNMHWPYSLIDAEWDEMGNGGTVEDAVAYGNSKKIGMMVWYNSSMNWVSNGAPGPFYRLNDPVKREKEFSWLEKIGVKGIKVDFFKGDDAQDMNLCIDLLKSAARHHLMVVFHGATLPRGWQRTYPNLMTTEAVYGAEWYNNNNTMTHAAACHNATLPFTRNIVGSMDYTPGTFTDSQYPHITTHAHELALPILFESALLHNPDRPSAYEAMPTLVKKLFATLPTVWDETRLLSGYPGTSVVIARRKGNTWYVGGINGTDQKLTLSLSPYQLAPNAKTFTLFTDGSDGRSFIIDAAKTTQQTIKIDCLPRGGFVAVIRR